MLRFTAKMQYSEESVHKLALMQYRTFQAGKRLGLFAAAVLLLMTGFSLGLASLPGLVCFFAGCILITGIDAPPRRTARTLLNQLNGKYPQLCYLFADEGFSSTEEEERRGYGSVLRLIDDGRYFYIYVDEAKAYMVDRSTAAPSAEGLRSFLEEKTGRSWERPTTILNMNVRKLRK